MTGHADDDEGDGWCAVPVTTRAGVWARLRRGPRSASRHGPLAHEQLPHALGALRVGTTDVSEGTRDVGCAERAASHQRTPPKQRTP